MTIKLQLKELTPEFCADGLQKNVSNRPFMSGLAAKLAQEIAAGRWQVNGETIKFDFNDKLIDGQHRLTAVVKTGIPVWSWVAYGIDPKAYDTIDQGKPRSLSDMLAKAGEKNYTYLASALKWCYVLDNKFSSIGSASKMSGEFFHILLTSHKGLRDSVTLVRSYDSGLPFNSGMVSALHYLFAKKDRQLADQFISRVVGGEGLTKGMVEYKLRQFFIKEKADGKFRETKQDARCLLIVRAWNTIRRELKKFETTIASDAKREEII